MARMKMVRPGLTKTGTVRRLSLMVPPEPELVIVVFDNIDYLFVVDEKGKQHHVEARFTEEVDERETALFLARRALGISS